MGWFNAGTDQKNEAPDLFGCVELPEPASCFGAAEVPYGAKQRDALIALLRDDKSQTMCWPAVLKQSFTPAAPSPSATPLYGSPMLDLALGQVGTISKVIAALLEGHTESVTDSKKSKKGSGGGVSGSKKDSSGGGESSKRSKDDVAQFDNILPPEMPTAWVQCEQCRKWRRVAWFVNSEALPDLWECTMNTWDPDNATCDAPQDSYDPDSENTLGFAVSEAAIEPSSFVVGKKFDLFCNKNKVYYEAVVMKVKTNPKKPADKPKALFRFVGWGSRFDELISIDSDRIAPHNLYTNPMSRNPREQEKWQGRKNLYDEVKKPLAPAPSKTATGKDGAGKGGTGKGGAGKGKGRTGKATAAVSGAASGSGVGWDDEDENILFVQASVSKKTAAKRKRAPAKKATSATPKAVVHKVSADQLAFGFADDFEDIDTPDADNSLEMSGSDMLMEQVEVEMEVETSFEQSFETDASETVHDAGGAEEVNKDSPPLDVSFDDVNVIDEISPEKRLKVN